MKTLGFTEEERDKTYSIYKGFFSAQDKNLYIKSRIRMNMIIILRTIIL
jgi:hypothetical protein